MKKFHIIFLVTGIFFSVSGKAQTTYNDVAKIFYSECTGCHHAGGSAPISLMNFNDVNTNSASIVTDLNSGKMPPWLPDTAYGNVRFMHEQIISKADKDLILKWVTDGKKQGDPLLAPAAPFYDDYAYKLCPTPTMVLKMKPRKITHQEGSDCYPIKTNLTKARYLRAWEIVPGNASIVNYVLAGVDATGTIVGDTTGNCLLPAVTSYIGAYSPNAAPTVWPGKAPLRAGMLIPANAQINLQIHYQDGSLGKWDSTQIRLYFYPDTATNVRNISTTTDINNFLIFLFPNTVTTVGDSIAIDSSRSILGIFPNAHGICTSMHLDGVGANPNIKLLNIKKWDKDLASFYTYRKLVKFPTPYQLRASGVYDNRASNPDNPNSPPGFVTYSPSDTGEVQFAAFQWLRYKTGDENIDIESLLKCDTLLVCKPGAAGPITGSSTICLGQTAVSYSVAPVGNAVSYTWAYSGSGATIHGNGNAVTIDFAGNATAGNLTVKGVNECGVSGKISADKALTISSGGVIDAAGTITGPASVCVNQSAIAYTVPAINGAVAYSWTYTGTGATINGNGNSITIDFSTAAQSGDLTVKGTSNCSNGAVSAVFPITVHAIPSVPTVTVANNCGNAVLTSSATTGTYLWSPGGATTQAITVSTDGTYSVTVSTGTNCSATSTGAVTAIKPSPSITSSTGGTRCGLGTVVLGAVASTGTPTWYANATGGTALATGTSYTTTSLSATTTHYVDVTDNGCTSTPRTAVIATINNGPTATITGTAKVCEGSTGILSIALTGTAPWAFTYGSAAGPNPVTGVTTSTYTVAASAGTYTVAAVTDGSACAGTSSGSATIQQNTAIVVSNNLFTCNAGKTNYVVDFDISGGDTATYLVTGGAGSKTTPTHFTSATITAGTAYSFVVKDANNCLSVPVNGNPNCGCAATAAISGGGNVCNGSSSTITVALTGTSPFRFVYAIDGTSQPEVTGITGSTYTFTTTTNGTYTLVSVNDANCLGSTSGSATVSPANPTATISGGGGICAGGTGTSTLNFDLTSGTPPWSFTYSDGTTTSSLITSSVASKQVTVSAAGVYTIVSMSAGACSGTGSGSATVVINALPTVGSTLSSPTNTVCSGSTVTLNGTGAVSYVWSGGVTDGQAFVPANTTYTVIGTDANGCTNTATRSISLIPAPVVTTSSVPSSAAVCKGGSVTLKGAGAISYSWSGGINDNETFVPSATVTYTVTGTDGNNCTGRSTRVVTVVPLPIVGSVVAPSSTVCFGSNVTLNGTGASTYTWSGGVIDGQSFSPQSTTTYTVTGLMNNCPNTATRNIVVKDCNVGITEADASNLEISVYPNPNNGQFTISIKNANFKDLAISVVNMLGEAIFAATDKTNTADYTLSINLGSLPQGLYYLILNTGSETKVTKLVIQ